MKPIIFSTPMIQAILAGNKTQTRRIVQGDHKNIFWNKIVLNGHGGYTNEHGTPIKDKYNVGDIIWAREMFAKWEPSIFTPREAVQIFLEIKEAWIEELQMIDQTDAIAEGIVMNNKPHEGWYFMEGVYSTDSPVVAYQKLWEKINGTGSWAQNPYVWVISFEKVEKPFKR